MYNLQNIDEGSISQAATGFGSSEQKTSVSEQGLGNSFFAFSEEANEILHGSIQMLTVMLSSANKTAHNRSLRVQEYVHQICAEMDLLNRLDIKTAARLSQVGCVTIAEETLRKVFIGRELMLDEYRQLQMHPQFGYEIVSQISHLKPVAEIILYQEKLFNGGGHPAEGKSGEEIPLGARILKVALDYDKLIEGKMSPLEAYRAIEKRGDWYDSKIVKVLGKDYDAPAEFEKQELNVMSIRPGMLLAEDIKTVSGKLLITKDFELTTAVCLKLRSFVLDRVIREPIKVLVPLRKSSI